MNLDNTVPIIFPGGWTFLTWPQYQAIESWPYTSLPGPGYGCTSLDSDWAHTGGTLPPGLAVIAGTGIITGTVAGFSSGTDLTSMIQNYPDAAPLSGMDQSSYNIGNQVPITKTYDFEISGYNFSNNGQGPTVVNHSIIVLRDWDQTVTEWLKEDIYSIGAKL